VINKTRWIKKKFIGVDFSGSARAGNLIWLAIGVYENGGLKIIDCRRARDLPGGGIKRDLALTALRVFIGQQKNAVVGLDFPFSLPQQLVEEVSWENFILSFPGKYNSPGNFRKACFEAAGRQELKRKTERESKAPFSPYNLRLYRQTYFGICDLFYPLLKNDQISVLPMQEPETAKPWLIEICPASFLKHEGINISYKGRSECDRQEKYRARQEILGFMENTKSVRFELPELRETILNNRGGDALDSVIAAYCTLKVDGEIVPAYEVGIEGYIYY